MILFNDQTLLKTALTHRSAINEKKGSHQSNERLEFLGDAILELVVSDFLFKTYPKLSEGRLTQKRAAIVQTKTLAAAAIKLNLGQNLIMSKGEKKAGGQTNVSLLANTFEALIGAIYLDQGFTKAADFIYQNLLHKLTLLLNQTDIHDFKSQLQETWQKQFQTAPKYQLVKSFGPDHNKTFIVKVFLKRQLKGEGRGKTKQAAEQAAAKSVIISLCLKSN
ncbi:MAG: Ribonuclease 3 [Candidatus Levybacteria bacterium GW2011_GWA2_40_8]|nr:MAG: Ribonuclease 3 [Candidatus Levybacteria bacterium GW2011_GWA2_40_8]